MIFQVKLADQVIKICSLCSMVQTISKDYIVSPELAPTFTVSIVDSDILKERDCVHSTAKRLGMSIPIVGEAYCESLAVLRKIADSMPRYDTLLMHGAVVAKDGQAYMFAADSGVGKTTRAKLWLETYPDSIVVNGDKPLIRITDSEVLACGTPWCGKEGWNTNTMVPLRAIFLVERSEDGENRIEEMTLAQAFPLLLRQVHRSSDSVMAMKTIHLLKEFGGKVRIYKFHSCPTVEAVKRAYGVTLAS